MANKKMLIATIVFAVFLLMTGVGVASMNVEVTLEDIVAEKLLEAGFDPAVEDLDVAVDSVLVKLGTEYEYTELSLVIESDPDLIAEVWATLQQTSDGEQDPDPVDGDDDPEDPLDEEDPIEDDEDLPPEENPDDEEGEPEKRAPRARAIERLREHLERGLPVENALAAVTKEKHRVRWEERERQRQEADDQDEETDDELDMDDLEDDLDENIEDIQKAKAKEEKEAAKLERKQEKEEAKQAKQDKKQEAKRERSHKKGQ